MAKKSAGLLLYRINKDQVEVFLVHPGGPYWKNRDEGAWSIPKGLYSEGEEPFEAAKREFLEETGFAAAGEFHELGELRQPGGKLVKAWAVTGDCDADAIESNTFAMEWPPGSGREEEFPEVDRAAWFTVAIAREKILPGQASFLDRLCEMLQNRRL